MKRDTQLAILWEERGRGAGANNEWIDRVEIVRQGSGTFEVWVSFETDNRDREPDVAGTRYQSGRFKGVARLLKEIQAAGSAMGRGEFSDAEVVRILSRLISVDSVFAAAALRQLAHDMGLAHKCTDLLGD